MIPANNGQLCPHAVHAADGDVGRRELNTTQPRPAAHCGDAERERARLTAFFDRRPWIREAMSSADNAALDEVLAGSEPADDLALVPGQRWKVREDRFGVTEFRVVAVTAGHVHLDCRRNGQHVGLDTMSRRDFCRAAHRDKFTLLLRTEA